MLLSVSMESDNHNGAIEIFEKRLDKYLERKFFALVWLHALKW